MTRPSNKEEGLVPANPVPANLPTLIDEGLVGKPYSYRAANQPTLHQGTNVGDGNQGDLLTNLLFLRGRINAGVGYMQTHIGNGEKFAAGRSRLTQLVVHEYRPALTDLIALTPNDQLQAMHGNVLERLERGWPMTGKGDDLFVELVLRYEVLCDALANDAVRTTLARIDVLEVIAA